VPERLRIFEPFRELDPDALRALTPALTEVRLAPGEVLMQRGDSAEHVYLLLRGRLAVESPEDQGLAPLALLGPGDLVGEIAVLAGGSRSATVRAAEASELLRLARADLELALERHPDLLGSFVDTVRRRLWRSQLGTHLRGLFGSPDPALLAELERDVEWVTLASGQELFRHGDPGDAAYIVMSGRLRVVDGAGRVLNEAAPGETLGEMALLADQPRSATVFAVRDSQLARIPTAAFNALIERYPSVLRRITSLLVARLWAHSVERKRGRATVKTIAIVAAGPRGDTVAFTRRLADALAKHGSTLHLHARAVDRALDRAGISACGERDPASVRLVQWLNEQEVAHQFVLYEADPHPSAWSERAARQADHVLFVADASEGPALGELERSLAERWQDTRAPRRSLVLLRRSDAGEPRGTSALLDGREVEGHYHVRSDSIDDFARLARWLTGRAVGVVLGGGGARGFAHLGVLRALAETGVPIDWVGGTSIGAIVAANVARGDAPSHCALQAALRSICPTLPLVSLLPARPRRVDPLRRAHDRRPADPLPVHLHQPLARGAGGARAGTARARDPREHLAARDPAPGLDGRGPARRRRAREQPADRRHVLAPRGRGRDRGRRVSRGGDAPRLGSPGGDLGLAAALAASDAVRNPDRAAVDRVPADPQLRGREHDAARRHAASSASLYL
jgi:CRP-like cAMP-binding protein